MNETGKAIQSDIDRNYRIKNLQQQLSSALKQRDEAISKLKPFTEFKLYQDYNFKSEQYANYYSQPCSFRLMDFENYAMEAREFLASIKKEGGE